MPHISSALVVAAGQIAGGKLGAAELALAAHTEETLAFALEKAAEIDTEAGDWLDTAFEADIEIGLEEPSAPVLPLTTAPTQNTPITLHTSLVCKGCAANLRPYLHWNHCHFVSTHIMHHITPHSTRNTVSQSVTVTVRSGESAREHKPCPEAIAAS